MVSSWAGHRSNPPGRDQTKNSDGRTVPFPDVVIRMLEQIEPKAGGVFEITNLRKAWQKACLAAKLGSFTKVEGIADPRYTGLILHDLCRSAIKNLMKAGVNEKVAMKSLDTKPDAFLIAITSLLRNMSLTRCVVFRTPQRPRVWCLTVKIR